MKIILKIAVLILIFLTSCTDKREQNNNETKASPEQVQEIKKIETLTNEMEKTTQSIEQTARELDAVLEEIDN